MYIFTAVQKFRARNISLMFLDEVKNTVKTVLLWIIKIFNEKIYQMSRDWVITSVSRVT